MPQSSTQPLLASGNNHYGSSTKNNTNHNPEENISWMPFLTVSWMSPLFKIGYQRQLQESDLYEMSSDRSAKIVGPQLQKFWDNERREAAAAGRRPSLLRALFWFIIPNYWLGAASLFFSGEEAKLLIM
jgi:hypothetical protein